MIELKRAAVANSRPQAGQRLAQSTTTTGRVAIELQVNSLARSWLAHKRQRQVEADEMRQRLECEQRRKQFVVGMNPIAAQISLQQFESEQRSNEERTHKRDQQQASRGLVEMGSKLNCDEKFDANSRSGPSTERNDRTSRRSSNEPVSRLAVRIKKQHHETVNLIALLSLLTTLGLLVAARLPWTKISSCDQSWKFPGAQTQSRVRVTCDTNSNHRNSFILLASAEGAPEIGSHRAYRRRNQQIGTKAPTNLESNQFTETPNEPAMRIDKIPIPVFTHRPEPNLKLSEGSSQFFRCATQEKMKTNYWTKDGSMLFDLDMKPSDAVKAARFHFVGDTAVNDYSIELRNAQVEDSGNYICHSYTALPEDTDPPPGLLVASNVVIEPVPPVTQSPSALASLANDHNIEVSTQQQLQHSQRSTNLTHATMPQSFQSESTLQPHNLIQPPPHMTRLTPSTNRLYQVRNSSTTSLKMDPRFSMPFVWPYVLLALAAILMLTNVYLIYSLIKRHTRRRRSDVESPSRERKLSSSSSSGVGSGSGQGSTSVHRLTK